MNQKTLVIGGLLAVGVYFLVRHLHAQANLQNQINQATNPSADQTSSGNGSTLSFNPNIGQ